MWKLAKLSMPSHFVDSFILSRSRSFTLSHMHHRDIDQEIPHEYICRGFQAEVRSRSSDR